MENNNKNQVEIDKDCIRRTAKIWSVYLGYDIVPRDVAMMMLLLKVVEEEKMHNPLNIEDIVKYAQTAETLNAF